MRQVASQRIVHFEVDGDNIAATIYRPPEQNGEGIIFIHGWKSSQKTPAKYASELAAKGYHCLTFDLRGMGDSEGDINSLTRQDFLQCCLAAYDYLKSKTGIDAISVAGSSSGSYLACLLAAKRKLKTLVLRAPADYSNAGFSEQPQIIVSDRLDRDGLNGPKADPSGSYALDALAKFTGKILIVQSENDMILPPAVVARYVDAAPKNQSQHIVMLGAPHSLSGNRQYEAEYLNAWFVPTEI